MKYSADGGGCFPTGRHYPGIAHLLRASKRGLAEEFPPETPITDVPLVAVDTETTGRDYETDRIVEIACVLYRNNQVVSRESWLIHPGCPIAPEAVQVHGITDEKVRDQPTFDRVADAILQVLAGHIPVAYNAEFDRGFLHAELSRAGRLSGKLPPAARPRVDWIDPLVWARELYQEAKSKSLGDMCERLGIHLERAHRATDDAEAALQVLLALARDSRVPRTYASFMQEQRRLMREFAEERNRWRAN